MGKENNAPSSGQLRAMTESGRNLLVSAAAGSGKTYTLVERIVKNIIAGKYRIDELLVVTFTNAAAAEMRERIEKKLTDELENHPELAYQLVLLSNASISTLHSFCQRLIRENFTAIDVDPKFRLLNEQERELIRQRVVQEVFEQKYEAKDTEFLRFVRNYGSDRDDSALYEMVLDLHRFAESQPDPKGWLAGIAGRVSQWGRGPIEQMDWYPYLKDKIARTLTACKDAAKYFSDQAEVNGISTYAEIFANDWELVDHISKAAATGLWEDMRKAFSGMPPKFPNLRKPPKMELDQDTVDFYKEGRKEQIKSPLEELRDTYFSETEESLLKDLHASGADIATLCSLTSDFIKAFDAAKRKKAALDFGDLEHFALAVLNREETLAAIKKRYKEIMVDEYQDTNGVQEAILGKITDGRNLFMVGDVKQSIYRFRLADPTLFTEKQNDYRQQGGHGACIELSENYRSRKEVLAAVNFLFSQLMMEPETELSYDERAALYPKADYPVTEEKSFAGAPVELLLVRNSDASGDDDEAEELRGFEAEAEIVAQKLRELKDSNVSIYDKDKKEYRPIRWQDMAVLLRAVKGKSQLLLEKLRAHDIPAYAEADAGYFEEKEVSLVLALLAVIDNAHQDIPLAAVLHSMIGGMTAKDLAAIRADAEDTGDFYDALSVKAETDANGKAARFFGKLEEWRKLSRRVGVPELLWQLYRDTGYYDYVGAQPGGLVRQANLRMLIDRAADYEKTNFRGLFRFLKFVRQMKDQDTDLSVARTLGEKEDVVRIMTVHKSKGLEFPVVVLANLSKKLNFQDVQKKVLIHKNLGIGMYCTKSEGTLTWQYPTIAWRAMKEAIQNEAKAEELRVLYVALTRAREKLILVGSVKSSAEKCAKVWCRYTERKETALPGHTVLGAKNWLDWIGTAVARDEDAGEALREKAGVSELPRIEYPSDKFGKPNFDLRFVTASSCVEGKKEETVDEWTERIRNLEPLPISENSERASMLSWNYGHYTDIPVKMTVTEIKRRAMEQEEPAFFAQARPETSEDDSDAVKRDFPPPDFLQAEEIKKGGVVFGTLMHGVMQNLRLDSALDEADIESQLDTFVKEGALTEEERRAVRVLPIAKFFASSVGRRMKEAKRCWREQSFSLLIPASEMEPKASPQDEIFLQGTIDVFFEDAEGRMVLLDYKTDRGTTPELIRKRYKTQLDLYARAIENITGLQVDEKYIYRLSDGDTIVM